jgi:hypothetical protein
MRAKATAKAPKGSERDLHDTLLQTKTVSSERAL